MKEEIEKALAILNAGGIILYPTDTVWGIGCDATNCKAIEKIFTLKKRQADKSLILLLDQDIKLNKYVKEVPELAWDLVEFAENPLTVIYPDGRGVCPTLIADDKSIAIRIVKNIFCQQLINRLKNPLVSTSANISRNPTPRNFEEISQEIKDGVDYIVNLEQDKTSSAKPSTIIKLDAGGLFTFIRR